MNTILVIGNYDAFTKLLFKKLHTEKWQIYTLINKKSLIKPIHVFEQYVFDYKSDTVKEVIESCRPDVILFTGAYDSSYNWNTENTNEIALNYIADLSNILVSAAALGIKHFVYLSSEAVFEDEYVIDIEEDMPVTPDSYKGVAIALGENITLYFGQTSGTETTVVRLANMFIIPEDRDSCNDPISRMCLEAIINGRLKVNAKTEFSCLYVKDAVEALYLLISAFERRHNLYHVSSTEEVTEDKIASLIKDNCKHPVEIVDNTVGLRKRVFLSCQRFCSEFHFEIKNSYRDIVPKIITHMDKHRKHFLYSDENYWKEQDKNLFKRLFRKAVPFIECIILFVPVFAFSHGIIDNQYFSSVNFYLLYVLLFSVVYGSQQAIFSSLLSVIGNILSRILKPTDVTVYLDTDLYIRIAEIFIVGLTVGYLKDKYYDLNKKLNDEIDFLKEKLNDIKIINTSNRKIKDYYTDKLINSRESIGRIYDITSKIHKAEKGEVLFVALDILKEIMGTREVSIYLVSNNKYCRLASSTGEKAGSLGKSLLIKDYAVIFDALRMKQVFINRTLDNKLPMMASALFDDRQNMRIVIFLWDMPYDRMTLYNANLLTVVGALIYSAFVQGANYMDALAYRRYVPGTKVLREDAFNEMVDIYKRAKERGYTESCILFIKKEDLTVQEVNDKLRPMLRETDYIGLRPDGNIAVLLTNTSESESVYVRERLGKANIKTYLSYNI